MIREKIIQQALLGIVVILVTLIAAPMIAGAAGTPSGTSISNQATATYQDAVANNFAVISNTTTVTVTSVWGVAINSPSDNTAAYINRTAYYAYTLTNTGNDNNSFALTTSSSNSWTVSLFEDTNGNGTFDTGEGATATTGTLTPDATYRFLMAVTVPNDNSITSGTFNDATLFVDGANGGANDNVTDTVRTTIVRPTLSVLKEVRLYDSGSFAATADAAPDNVVEYRVTVTNNGSVNADNVVLSDPINVNTGYEINSAAFNAGSSGLTAPVTAEFSNNAGSTWLYSPASGCNSAPAGYDYCVTNVRWRPTGSMTNGGANFNVIFRVRVK